MSTHRICQSESRTFGCIVRVLHAEVRLQNFGVKVCSLLCYYKLCMYSVFACRSMCACCCWPLHLQWDHVWFIFMFSTESAHVTRMNLWLTAADLEVQTPVRLFSVSLWSSLNLNFICGSKVNICKSRMQTQMDKYDQKHAGCGQKWWWYYIYQVFLPLNVEN